MTGPREDEDETARDGDGAGLEARLHRERGRELTPAEAERQLASSGERPLPEGELERIVAQRPGVATQSAPEPGRTGRWIRASRWLAVPLAALLVVCAVRVLGGSVRVISGPPLFEERSATHLGSDDAAEQMLDRSLDVEARNSGMLGVFLRMHWGLGVLEKVASGPDPVASRARAGLRRLEASLSEAEGTAPARLAIDEAGKAVLDEAAAPAARAAAVDRLVDELERGIRLIRLAETWPEPLLHDGAPIVLGHLRTRIEGLLR